MVWHGPPGNNGLTFVLKVSSFWNLWRCPTQLPWEAWHHQPFAITRCQNTTSHRSSMRAQNCARFSVSFFISSCIIISACSVASLSNLALLIVTLNHMSLYVIVVSIHADCLRYKWHWANCLQHSIPRQIRWYIFSHAKTIGTARP